MLKKHSTICFIALFFLLAFAVNTQGQEWKKNDSLALQLTQEGLYDSAVVFAEKALQLIKDKVGEEDTLYAYEIKNIGEIYYYKGNSGEAENKYLQALEILHKKTNHETEATALLYSNLSVIYNEKSLYSQAEEYIKKSIDIYTGLFGKYYESCIIDYDNMASILKATGKYTAAEVIYTDMINHFGITKECKTPEYSVLINNYGQLCQFLGNYDKAVELFIKSSEYFRQKSGSDNPFYLSIMINLGMVFGRMEQYEMAERIYTDIIPGIKKIYGVKHPNYSTALNNLSLIYSHTGRNAEATKLMLEVLELDSINKGVNSYKYSVDLVNTGMLYKNIHALDAAKYYLLKGISLRQMLFDESHPECIKPQFSLADLYFLQGDFKKADSLFLKMIPYGMDGIKKYFSFLSETEREKYSKSIFSGFYIFFSYTLHQSQRNPQLAGDMYNFFLTSKNLLFNSSQQIKNKVLNSGDKSLIDSYNRWIGTREMIGVYGQYSKKQIKANHIHLDSLENLANNQEKEIAERSGVFRSDVNAGNIQWPDVRNALPASDLAVEFVQFPYFNNRWTDTVVYCALVLGKDYPFPKLVPLCYESHVADALKKTDLYQTTSQVKGIQPIVSTYIDNNEDSKDLYKLVWKPLDSLMKGKKNIFVSLTGLLNKISINALKDEKGELLLDKYNIHFINSSRELAEKQAVQHASPHSIALFGGISYDLDSLQMAANADAEKKTGKDIMHMNLLPGDTSHAAKWKFLPATLSEVNAIADLFAEKKWVCSKFTGNTASEEAFRKLGGAKSPAVIHISTHGFFLPDPKTLTDENNTIAFKSNQNSMLRSGLLFSGANRTWSGLQPPPGAEDGVLTAYEVSNTWLGNTELVVLSACETGLGNIESSEGVYGMQRAFQIAGARSVIMSLWQVPDKETVELMTLFYKNWLDTNDKHDAFRKAAQAMAKKYPPYYWAAFVLVE